MESPFIIDVQSPQAFVGGKRVSFILTIALARARTSWRVVSYISVGEREVLGPRIAIPSAIDSYSFLLWVFFKV